MYWFLVGNAVGLISIVLFILALCNKEGRKALSETVFENTIYGDMMENINDGDSSDEDYASLFGFSLIFSVITIIVCLILFLVSTLLSYIMLAVYIAAFFFTEIIKKNNN